ncbi:oxygen-regulated invasion protein OrgB [Pseudomonas carnis]|uniref:oxygen-regulated invasion protein OrgB n=1 Tax=Pseudomonas carnis TaxID=2487355 RepID=UPI001CA64142|nr:oxygen-regulated invasion protein OrgB [Pseudomonas carnis]MBY8955625.1 oxygen-regulated invasion protein OrgB [Pseudomonas carnis]
MLESIRTLVDIPSADTLLVRSEDRVAARARRLLMQEARDRAKVCVAQAQSEVECIQASAYQAGYAQGVLASCTDLSVLLLESRVIASKLQTDLLQAARSLLGDVLMDEQLLDRLLERWRASWSAQSGDVLQIILPMRCKSEKMSILEKLERGGVDQVDIKFHTQERYLFRLADQVVEFDIGATQERLAPRLINQIERLPASVRQLDDASRDLLVEWSAGLCGDLDLIKKPEN